MLKSICTSGSGAHEPGRNAHTGSSKVAIWPQLQFCWVDRQQRLIIICPFWTTTVTANSKHTHALVIFRGWCSVIPTLMLLLWGHQQSFNHVCYEQLRFLPHLSGCDAKRPVTNPSKNFRTQFWIGSKSWRVFRSLWVILLIRRDWNARTWTFNIFILRK